MRSARITSRMTSAPTARLNCRSVPGKMLLRNSSGVLARLVEGWATSFIVNLSTGQPMSVSAANMLYAGGVPDVVGAIFVEGLRQG